MTVEFGCVDITLWLVHMMELLWRCYVFVAQALVTGVVALVSSVACDWNNRSCPWNKLRTVLRRQVSLGRYHDSRVSVLRRVGSRPDIGAAIFVLDHLSMRRLCECRALHIRSANAPIHAQVVLVAGLGRRMTPPIGMFYANTMIRRRVQRAFCMALSNLGYRVQLMRIGTDAVDNTSSTSFRLITPSPRSDRAD